MCATDPTYKTDDLQQAGVAVAQLPFPDGSAPTGDILEKWLHLVKKAFQVSIAKATKKATKVGLVVPTRTPSPRAYK